MSNSFKNKFLLLFLLTGINLSTATAQQKTYDKSFYGGLFYLSDYVASDEFKFYTQNHSDLEAVDHIYEKGLSFFEGDKSETFFCLAFLFLPYNNIKIKLPVTGTVITIPLPSAPSRIFDKKTRNTPKKIFFDTPDNDSGDRDKLAHFFANAFLRHSVSIFNLSEFLGIFVEYIEQGFFLQGGFDRRDLIVNHLGELFAEMVRENPNAKPSEALLIYQLLIFRIYP